MHNYHYSSWGNIENIAAAGIAEYEGAEYYFMMLYAEQKVWFALSVQPYDTYWESGTV